MYASRGGEGGVREACVDPGKKGKKGRGKPFNLTIGNFCTPVR